MAYVMKDKKAWHAVTSPEHATLGRLVHNSQVVTNQVPTVHRSIVDGDVLDTFEVSSFYVLDKTINQLFPGFREETLPAPDFLQSATSVRRLYSEHCLTGQTIEYDSVPHGVRLNFTNPKHNKRFFWFIAAIAYKDDTPVAFATNMIAVAPDGSILSFCNKPMRVNCGYVYVENVDYGQQGQDLIAQKLCDTKLPSGITLPVATKSFEELEDLMIMGLPMVALRNGRFFKKDKPKDCMWIDEVPHPISGYTFIGTDGEEYLVWKNQSQISCV